MIAGASKLSEATVGVGVRPHALPKMRIAKMNQFAKCLEDEFIAVRRALHDLKSQDFQRRWQADATLKLQFQ